MKSAILFGAGADIGCNLLGRNDPERDGFAITDVVTRRITADPELASLSSLDQLHGRLLLADPALLGRVSVDETGSRLIIDGRPVTVHFREVEDDSIFDLGRFDLAILATHRTHIRSPKTLARLGRLADRVVGLAENPAIPALYPPLAGADTRLLGLTAPVPDTGRVYAMGSCQSVGWAAQLRGLLEAAGLAGLDELGLLRAEVEVVHPDTASSRLGTQGIGARREDARDNLRPGFSQLQSTMLRLPGTSALNTVSLRVLTQPPGYQVCRFFVRARLDADTIRAGFTRAADLLPDVVRTTDLPIGSRAFFLSPAAATVITADSHLKVVDDVLPGSGVTEVITQAYVHNTIGYCVSVLAAGRLLVTDSEQATLLPPLRTSA
ncbi:hypothetical protein ACFQ73_09135 [Amycolatopsis japonica]|uniref:hypothetical protein n=1 Tax=Amycolatopsis japonica TaxID=208439 RepID=UPI00366CA609